MKWLIISSVIIKTWKNSIIKGLKLSPLVVIFPILLVGVIFYFQWSNYDVLNVYFRSSFTTSNGARDLLSKLISLTTLLTIFITIVLHHISAAKNEFIKMFIYLPIKLGDIVFGYSFPFIAVVTALIALLLSPMVIALISVLGPSAASLLIIISFISMIATTVCFILLIWVLIEVFAMRVLGENGSYFTKLVTPVLFLFPPFIFVLLSGDLNSLNQLLLNNKFLPSYWFVHLIMDQSNVLNILFSTLMIVTLLSITILLWWLSSKLIWQPSISANSRIKFFSRLPFFTKKPLINITLVEIKQSLRDIESLSYLFISIMMFLILYFSFKQLKFDLSAEEVFPLIKSGLYVVVLSVATFALTSRARDMSAEWLFRSLPLSYTSYVSGKWLANILILTPFYMLMAISMMKLATYNLSDSFIGISMYLFQLILFITIAFLSGIIHKVKKQNAIDQLVAVLILAVISFISVAVIQYLLQIIPGLWPNINLNFLEASISLLLTFVLLASAVLTERLRSVG